MALRRSGSGKPNTSSLHRIGSSCQDEDRAIAAIDGWRRGSPGSVKVAHWLTATDIVSQRDEGLTLITEVLADVTADSIVAAALVVLIA
jgi:hypothetical protein